MKRTMKYMGLDVHQATTVVSVRDASGHVILRCVLPTEAAALLEFFGLMRGSVQVAFEEGTQAQWLHDLLLPVVERVIVCDRRGESRRGNKADQVDADELSRLLRSGDLRAVYHGGRERATLRELTRTYRGVVEDSTRVMLRLKALFRARAIQTRGTRLFSPTGHVDSGASRPRCGQCPLSAAPGSRTSVRGTVSSETFARPKVMPRHAPLTPGALAEPEETSGRPPAESQIEPWFAPLRPRCFTECPQDRNCTRGDLCGKRLNRARRARRSRPPTILG